MDRLKSRYRDWNLRQSFIVTVAITFGIVVLLSLAVIWGCASLQHWLLPDSNQVYLSLDAATASGKTVHYTIRCVLGEDTPSGLNVLSALDENGNPVSDLLDPSSVAASVTRAESDFTLLSPKRKLLYQACDIAMVAVPVLISIGGVLLCGFTFYRKKLEKPLMILSQATAQIAAQDLDFTLHYDAQDELGQLCQSFEKMRQALEENNRAMWKMLEERKLIQASVAHDLRNPIAIIQGYAEYLQLHLPARDLSPEKAEETVSNIAKAARRLEQYTESVRAVNQLEEIEIHPTEHCAAVLMTDLTADLSQMAVDAGKILQISGTLPDTVIRIDTAILYRVLENLLSNAIRFAESQIQLSCALQEHTLSITVSDDGPGYPEEILSGKARLLLSSPDENGHCGMGLTVCRILCQKHGGSLTLSNRTPHGAAAKILLPL